MSKAESFYNIGYIDKLSCADSFIHRLDPRAKLITTLVFILAVVSVNKYDISVLLPFFLFPVVVASLADLPLSYIAKKLFFIMPFAVMVGIFNPLFDKQIIMHIGNTGISGGWISFLSIILRSMLTISAALILLATTGFYNICLALERMKAPKMFVLQLMFLYRYIFVLIEETHGLVIARSLRSFDKKSAMGMRVAASMMGQLLLRSINRARRIHMAMLSRGFDGDIRLMTKLHFDTNSFVFMIAWCLLFVVMRKYNVALLIGGFARDLGGV